MKRSSKIFLVIFAIVLIGVAALATLVIVWWATTQRLPRHAILEVEIHRPLIEHVPADPFAGLLMERRARVRDFVEALEAAAADDRVAGLVAKVTPTDIGLAQLDELRDAILAFRESGKPAIAWADSFGEVLPANGAYFLASAFDEVYIQPSGDVGLTGLLYVHPFLRGTLEKIGVTPRMAQRYEYKNAMNLFTEEDFTEAHRESMQGLADSVFDHMVTRIAEARGLDPVVLRGQIDRGPFIGQEAVEAGLVDGLLYRDEVYQRARALAGENGARDPSLLYLRRYWQRAERPYAKGRDVIALVYGVGPVTRGRSRFDPLTGDSNMGGDSVAAAIRAAVDDERVRAIVLRVDSPGGSYVASDMIWREVVRARQAGKPVIISMGDLAASGGYFVAMAADRIVAQPGTITGSIGVLGGKFLMEEMWSKLGVSFDSVQAGDNAHMWSALHDFDEAQWERFNRWLDRVYDDFTAKVAEGRGLTQEQVHQIAKGRIWSGVDALQIGLVDELGGLSTAIHLARDAAGIDPDVRVRVREFPSPRTPLEMLFGEPAESSEQEGAYAALVRVVEAIQPLARLARDAGLIGPPRGALSMPPIELVH
jgi:protease IV